MAWEDIELSINGGDKDSNDLITRSELFAVLSQIESNTKYYQIEPFEIMDIARSGNSLIPGQVIGRNIYSEQGKDADVLQTYLPLNSNVIQYPVVGEIWFGLHYGNETTKRYYLSRVPNDILSVNYNEAPNHPSAQNEVSANELQRGDGSFLLNNDSSAEVKQGEYFKDTLPRKEIGNEGDTIIQGRFGNSIRLGSRQLQGFEDSPQITLNSKKSIIDLLTQEDVGTITMNSDNISINAKKDVFIFSEGEVDIKGDSINIRNNEAINMVTQQMVTDYVGGVKKDLNIELNQDTKLLPKNSIEYAKQMEPFITYIQGEIQAIAYLLLPPTLPGGAPNPAFIQGYKIKFDVLKKLAKKIKEFFDLDFLPKHDFETVSINEFLEALGLNNLSIDFPVDDWQAFFDDIDGAKQRVLQAQAEAAQQLAAVQALNTAFTALQQGGGSVSAIVAALDAYEADENNPPIDTTDIRDIISDGADAEGIQNYLNNGGSPQVREAIQGAVQAEQESQQLNQLVKIAELTR